jgi:asparagine synthase (glutamine-hydrolysing)
MCGIAGLFDRSAATAADQLTHLTWQMGNSLQHRGPDAGDIWIDPAHGIGLAHRRLSIVDLSPLGNQPMASASGRYVTVYNGEIFNFQDLRQELEAKGASFRGTSDTEVMLAGIEQWGVEATVKRMIGMFAIALWDRQEGVFYLIRDRLGIKPLYWGLFGDLLLFGSELKALLAHPGWQREIDRDALTAFMRHNYVPAPYSIYRGIRKLRQGHILTLRPGRPPTEEAFWNLRDVVGYGRSHRLDLSDQEATDELETLLKDAVGRRMIADVPLGAFLSGGIDSSLVVALMQAQSDRPVKTFSIGFHEQGFDEAIHAKAVAQHLGTDHTELYVNPAHALEIIPDLPRWYDEPFADSSQIPTFLVSEMTRKHVTVALSGDGGDELFAGYNRYTLAMSLWRKIGSLPLPLRRAAAQGLRSLSPATWDKIFRFMPSPLARPQAGDKLWKLADVLPRNGDAIYKRLISHWEDPADVVLGGREPAGLFEDSSVSELVPDFMERMQYLDTATYMADDILTKVDRASMAVALEARVPLIDHRVVEYSWRLPSRFKIRNGQTKWLLRQVLYRHVPPNLIERPKMGFGVPIDAWLRGPLRDWAEALLSEDKLRREGLFNPAPIRQKWQEHLSGSRNWQYLLWDVLMAQAWRDMYWHNPAEQPSLRPVPAASAAA